MSSSGASSIRRIQRELKEINESPSRHWMAAPVADDLFEWMFAVRGPPGTDFEGGIYAGRLALPVNYPLAPPSITMLTPNGRWEVGKKICLSNTNYHAELWQPAWGIRTMMEALRSHFPVPGDGAIGAIDLPSDLRKRLAKESLDCVCPTGKKNRELLPELSPEELKEDMPEPPPVRTPALVPEDDPTLAPAPPAKAVLPEQPPAGEDHILPPAAVTAAAPAAPVPRRQREGPRPTRQQRSVLVQLMRPPQNKRAWLLLVIDVLTLFFAIMAVYITIDIILDPPQILDALPSVTKDAAGSAPSRP